MDLNMLGITKSFGANDVLRGVDFSLKGGEICALLGENGAGKSTLMNILGGVHSADNGEILLDGKPRHFKKPAESLHAGIAFIHQELNLINDLTIYENMFIGREITRRGILDRKAMVDKVSQVFARMDVELDPEKLVEELDAAYKQIVEIARALLMNASIIIMDEPTTALTDPEIDRVFDMMRTLQQQGVGIVFISHKLREVMAVCTEYTVLRDGAVVAFGKVENTNTDDLAHHMVGRNVRTESLGREKKLGEVVLEAKGFGIQGLYENVNFELHAGEILGFTGLLGDGRSELFQTVFGCYSKYDGQILVAGKQAHPTTNAQAMKLGIGYVPGNRKENGIVKDMSILDNGTLVTLKKFIKGGLINANIQKDCFGQQREQLRIKMEDESDLISRLSGGNQQKVVLAKWLVAGPKILIFDNPTQGVDVGAKEDIYDIILKLAANGVAIVILSSEAQEIIRICDSAVVMFHGKIQRKLSRSEMNEGIIMKLATGSMGGEGSEYGNNA